MNLRNLLRWSAAVVAVAGVCLAGTPSAQAQGGFGGGGGMPPEIAAKIKAWQKWGDSHKNAQTLSDMIFQIGEMNKTAGFELDKKQASTLLGIINPWRSKPDMSESEAKEVNKKIGASLTTKQIKKMTTIETPRQKMRKNGGGMGGGGGARPGGGGGAGGAGGFKFPDPPKGGWNPLNPETFPFEMARPQMKAGMDKFVGDLQSRAK